jgi:hypothetical protein
MSATALLDCDHLAGLVPDPDAIRQRLDRCRVEAALLRRLLRLSLTRQREAERLARQQGGGGGRAA